MSNHVWMAAVLLTCALGLACTGHPRGEKPKAPLAAPWSRPAGWDRIASDPASLEKYRCPPPSELGIVFSFGYASDLMPKDDARFEQLLRAVKAAGFNTIHATYTPARVELCRKHGVKMMIDFLAPGTHVYQDKEGCQAVCAKVEGDPAVWGYNLWNGHFGPSAPGRRHDINNVRTWDPSHPGLSSGYRNEAAEGLPNADVMSYYDFHWDQKIELHFVHLLTYLDKARQYRCNYYAWLMAKSSDKADLYHRSLWSANTSLACGLKGILWFLAPMDKDTLRWEPWADSIIRVNREIRPLRHEIMRLGLPTAVYATRITRSNEDEPLPRRQVNTLPPGLENNAFPNDFWIQPAGGEFVMGVFKDQAGRDAIFVANYNSQAPQHVALKLARDAKVSRFNRKEGKWQTLKVDHKTVQFKLDPAAGELLRLE